jgi:hypothetical protein
MHLHAHWIVGFVDGEGCFHVGVNLRPDITQGVQILPEFTVVQHQRDLQVLHALKAHFGCGQVVPNHGARWAYRVRRHRDLLDHVVPFFERHPLKTRKGVAFRKWRRVVRMMADRAHLSPEGVAQIKAIQQSINRVGTDSVTHGNRAPHPMAERDTPESSV